MRAFKVGLVVVGVAVVAVALYLVLTFVKQVGDVFLATLRSGQRTAEYNEQIAANLAGANVGDKLASLTVELQSVLRETTQTLQAVRPVIAETAATTRTARLAISETAEAAKAARTAIEGARLPDVDRLVGQTSALLEQTTTLVRDVNASAPPLLATSQQLLDRVDHLVADSDLTATMRTTGRILANVEQDQGKVSVLVANAVPVSEAVKNEVAFVQQELAAARAKRSRGLFSFLARLF
jgi:uncharacterized protein YoxC